MSITINLEQAQKILEIFGGEDAEVTIIEGDEKYHSGKGLYAYFTELPEEGAFYLGEVL